VNGCQAIDADGHPMGYPEIYLERMEEPYARRSRRATSNPSVGSWYPAGAHNRGMDQALGPPGRDLQDRLSSMCLQGIDVAVLYPTFGLSFLPRAGRHLGISE
jgi:hypothetical protein